MLPRQQVVKKEMVCIPFVPSNLKPGPEFEIRVQVADNVPGVIEVW